MSNYYDHCPETAKYKNPTLQEFDSFMNRNQYCGGFRYSSPISPLGETISYIRSQVKKQMSKKICNITVTIFMPLVLFESVFPPTQEIFGWNRCLTSGGNKGKGRETIKVSHNFRSLNYIFGDDWYIKQFVGGSALCFRPYKGVTISRNHDGEVKIKIPYFLKSREGFLLR